MISRNEKGQFLKGTYQGSGFKKGIYQGFGFKKGGNPWNKGLVKRATKKCLICHTEFKANAGNDNKYCSQTCYNLGRKKTKILINCNKCGKEFYTRSDRISNLGKFCSKKCISEFLETGKSYTATHQWIIRRLGKPTTCEHCQKTGLTGRHIHWANKDHSYKKDLDNWIRLCVSCHRKYDYHLLKNKQLTFNS